MNNNNNTVILKEKQQQIVYIYFIFIRYLKNKSTKKEKMNEIDLTILWPYTSMNQIYVQYLFHNSNIWVKKHFLMEN